MGAAAALQILMEWQILIVIYFSLIGRTLQFWSRKVSLARYFTKSPSTSTNWPS